MKKILGTLLLFMLILSSGSCKKDRSGVVDRYRGVILKHGIGDNLKDFKSIINAEYLEFDDSKWFMFSYSVGDYVFGKGIEVSNLSDLVANINEIMRDDKDEIMKGYSSEITTKVGKYDGIIMVARNGIIGMSRAIVTFKLDTWKKKSGEIASALLIEHKITGEISGDVDYVKTTGIPVIFTPSLYRLVRKMKLVSTY